MRSITLSAAASALLVGLSACTSAPATMEAGTSDGITGATIHRPAVQGDHIDFGTDMNSVESYDLATQRASVDNPVASDSERDREIDSIVDKLSNDASQPSPKSAAPWTSQAPAQKRTPAVPPLSQSGASFKQTASAGVTGSVEPESKGAPLAPLPPVARSAQTSEDASIAAAQDRLFPKPRWRRELEERAEPALPDARTPAAN